MEVKRYCSLIEEASAGREFDETPGRGGREAAADGADWKEDWK